MTRAPSADELMAEAEEARGLMDFGPGDFREGLRALLDSVERDVDLHPDATARVIADFRRRLVNRREVEAWYGDHPEIDGLPVHGPVDINGLPRTGTTALAGMLSLDPQFRSLRHWEQWQPCPPPVLGGETDDPRPHTFHLEAVVAAYPDVQFVVTHRDPAKAVPSYASLVSNLFPPTSGERDHHRLGREVSDHLRIGVERAMDARARLGEDRFVDIHHGELVADPFGTVRRLYSHLGLDLTWPVETAVSEWQQSHHPGARGTHTYTAEQFGLSPDRIRSDYHRYIQHFGIEIET